MSRLIGLVIRVRLRKELGKEKAGALPQNGKGLACGFHEVVGFFLRVVEGEGGTGGGGYAELVHERLAAMVTRTDGDALGVEEGGEVVRMDVFYGEGDDGGFLRSLSVQGEAGKGGESLGGQLEEALFCLLYTSPSPRDRG